jgi:multidrug/hemolysin transport system permease protein
MIALIKRNLKIFYRDRAVVLFSLLTVVIIIALYSFFLGDLMVRSIEETGLANAKEITDSWVMAGLLTVISVTTTLGAVGVMVEDKSKKIINDFKASPISRSSLIAGYMLSSFIIGIIMSVVALVIAELYIVFQGGSLLTISELFKVFGCIVVSVFSGGAMVFYLASLFKSQNAFNNANIVIGTLIGFLTGIYIPIGELPAAVQTVIKLFPPSHAGSLFRRVMLDTVLQKSFSQAPASALQQFNEMFGITFSFGNHTVSVLESILVLVATALMFYGLALFNISRKQETL